MAVKLSEQNKKKDPNYIPSFTEEQAEEFRRSEKRGSEREQAKLISSITDKQMELIMENGHCELELLFPFTTPSAALSINGNGFAATSGAGRDERIRLWGKDLLGVYFSNSAKDGFGKYPHSLKIAAEGLPSDSIDGIRVQGNVSGIDGRTTCDSVDSCN